jgi:RHS repeat-associated protein
MNFSSVAVQVLLLLSGQAQPTNAITAKGAPVIAALPGGCVEGATLPCTTSLKKPGTKTCGPYGTWGTCVADNAPPPCPSTTCRPAVLARRPGGWTCTATNAPLGTLCDDGDVCNGVEKCDGAGSCNAGPAPVVDDGNASTVDFCGPGGVTHVLVSSNSTGKEAFSTPSSGPDPRSRALPVAPSAGGPVVDESRGTLSYRYSFELPAARGRYQPALALNYTSGTTYNDSIGAGWSLTSYFIEADATASPESSSDTAPNRWWLVADGVRQRLLGPRLLGFGAATYRTEVQGRFVSISLFLSRWTAVDATGTVYRFHRRSPLTPGPVALGRWYLSEVEDVDGNLTRFTYVDESAASATLTSIDYNFFDAGAQTGTSVELTWTPDYLGRIQRAADTVAYRKNTLVAVRIKGASTAGKPTLLRHELTYTHQQQADTLLLMQVVVKAGETARSLPPTKFEYQAGTTAYQLAAGVAFGLEEYLTASKWNEQWLDLDGDGLPDRVAWPSWRRNTTTRLSAAPTFAPSATIPGAPLLTPAPAFVGNPLGAGFMDLDGDGVVDLVVVGDGVSSGPGCDYQVWFGQGTGSTYALSPTKVCIDASQVRGRVDPAHFGIRYASKTSEAHALQDVNGDGIPDLAQPDPVSGLLDVWLGIPAKDAAGNLTGFGFAAARTMAVPNPNEVLGGLDLNGDGMAGDYVAGGRLTYGWSSVYFAQGGSFSNNPYDWVLSEWAGGAAPPVAINEIYTPMTPPAPASAFDCSPTLANGFLVGVTFEDPRRTVGFADLNGDGLPDLLIKPHPTGANELPPSTCNARVGCSPSENLVYGAQCYQENLACPLLVYWNTGAGFERGGTIQAPACTATGTCPADLFPAVAYVAVPDAGDTGVQCLYMSGEPGYTDGTWLPPVSGGTTLTAWSGGFIDLDGDGVLDYATNRGGTWTFFKGSNVAPLLNKVITAAGAAYSVTYVSGTSQSVIYPLGSGLGAGPLDGARDVVAQVTLSGAGIPTATTSYRYAGPTHGPNPVNSNRVEPRGFSESWSWLAEQGAEKTARHTTWLTTSAILAGAPSRVEWGTFTTAEPDGGFTPFQKTEFEYLVKSLDSGTCTGPATPVRLDGFPVLPVTSLARTLELVGGSIWLGGQRTQACGDVDRLGNSLKTTILTNRTWNDGFLDGDTLVETTVYDLTATCKNCPISETLTTETLATAAGVTLSDSKYYYESPVGSWSLANNSAGKGHLNYVSRWVSGTRWEVASAQTYNADGTVASRVTDPFPGSHAVSTTESYTYDAQQLRVALTTRTDGAQTIYSSAGYDTKGLLVSQAGPYLAGGLAGAPTQAYARDAFGRVVAVGRAVSASGTTVTGGISAMEYLDTSPPQVRSYTFLAPTNFMAGYIPTNPDVRMVVQFKDELGRTTEVRERLGVAGTGNAGSQVIQPLSGYRRVSMVAYDAAGRAAASLEPTLAADGTTTVLFASVAATANIRGARTLFDSQGRVSCSASGVYAAINSDCSTSFTNDASYRVATAFSYEASAGPGGTWYATSRIRALGRYTGTATGVGIDTVTHFRADGLVHDVTDPAGNTITTEYDPLGRAKTVTRKAAGTNASAISTRSYDALGRVTEETDDNWSPGTFPSRTFNYDGVGRAFQINLAQQPALGGRRTQLAFEFKSMGRLTRSSVFEPVGTATATASKYLTTYAYDAPFTTNPTLYPNTAGRLSYIAGPTTTIALGYDQNGRVNRRDQWLSGLTGAVSLTGSISDDGRMLLASLFSGYSMAVNYYGRYDSAGRPVRVDAGGASAGAAPAVNLWEVVNATGTSNDGYDLLGRVGRLKSNFGTVSTYRNYEQFTGALASQSVVSIYGTRAYGVDSIVHVGTKLRSFDDTTVAGTTTKYGYTYDESGRLATAKATRVGPAAISQGYGQSYSASDPAWTMPGASLENLQSVTDAGGTITYQYAGDRVTALTGATAATMAYDHAGRMTSRVAASVEVEGFVHDSLDRLTTIRRNGAVSEVLEYAPTGEPVFRKLGTQGTWYVGAVATVTGTVAVSCTGIDTVLIPAASRCVAVVGTEKVSAHVQVAGGRVASIRAAAGTGVELDPVTEVLYYHRDMQGSVVATTYRSGGQNGFLGAKYRYTPYGALDRTENVTATTDSELGYTGGLRLGYAAGVAQQGNLVLLGARVYHAELKRWLVPDTVDGRRYTYAGGDPVNFVDPSGRMPIDGHSLRLTSAPRMFEDYFMAQVAQYATAGFSPFRTVSVPTESVAAFEIDEDTLNALAMPNRFVQPFEEQMKEFEEAWDASIHLIYPFEPGVVLGASGSFLIMVERLSDGPNGARATVYREGILMGSVKINTVGDTPKGFVQGVEVEYGTYVAVMGMHPMNPKDGDSPYEALNIYGTDGSRIIGATRPDGATGTAIGINIHIGNAEGSIRTGSTGCFTVPSDSNRTQWNHFMGMLPVSGQGLIIYFNGRSP